jgi:pimeloyl-ACP methyl ester carboxylesterase
MPRTPVVFVPGLTGSFHLPTLLDWRGPALNGWNFPPFIGYGETFVKAFQQAGYTRDKDLFVAFYDWRKSVKDSATNYLIPWLDRVKQRSGAAKVILVAHSMGGLVSRSYIQSDAYPARNDVERLITLGTPHRGSAESYIPWGSGEPQSDPLIRAVFNVYLWYLRHAHPFQTGLSPLRTMRTQVPGVRDLLPVDDYLTAHDGPPVPRNEDAYLERNLWGDLLNQQAAIETLCTRVPMTTIAGTGFRTVTGYLVAGAPQPPEDPPFFPDGQPHEEQHSGDGDGTVPINSARIDHPGVTNLPPVNVGHAALPDHPLSLAEVFTVLGVAPPTLGAAAEPPTRLVILTASPVTMVVTTPADAPASADVLGGSGATRRRQRRIRARNHGHAGKHLNMIVVDEPGAGAYDVQLVGTASGYFALGAFMVGPAGATVLGASGEDLPLNEPAATPIATTNGQVVAASELYYQVIVTDAAQTPEIRFDATTTRTRAVERLQNALGASDTVLGAGDPNDTAGLTTLTEQALGPIDRELALALLVQLQASA